MSEVTTIGDRVKLKKDNLVGIVRFIGEIEGKKGTFFGVELNKSKGKNDGSVGKITYFKCEAKRGLFVKKGGILKTNSKNNQNVPRVTVGDKVKCFKAGCNGTIRFIGTPYSIKKQGIYYGVELEKPNGKNNGTVKGRYYFKCKNNNKYGTFLQKDGFDVHQKLIKKTSKKAIKDDEDKNDNDDDDISPNDDVDDKENEDQISIKPVDDEKNEEDIKNELKELKELLITKDQEIENQKKKYEELENAEKMKEDIKNAEIKKFKELLVSREGEIISLERKNKEQRDNMQTILDEQKRINQELMGKIAEFEQKEEEEKKKDIDAQSNNETDEDEVVERIEFALPKEPDMTIFRRNGQKCSIITHRAQGTVDINKCEHIVRLILALRYYKSLNVTDYINHQEALLSFFNDGYKELLNDWIHLIHIHSNQMEQIKNDLIQNHGFDNCDIADCKLVSSHYMEDRTDAENINMTKDPKFIFYKDNMENIHFGLFHLLDVGLRSQKKLLNAMNTETVHEDDDDLSCIDHVFARQRNMILEQRKVAGDSNRFKRGNSKFNIPISKPLEKADNTKADDEAPFIDTMAEHLKTCDVSQKDMNTLCRFLYDEEYDTEAIEQDIYEATLIENCNIFKAVADGKIAVFISDHIQDFKVNNSAFSTGLMLYYWDYYKMESLYVNKKYDTFKEEILTYLDMKIYQQFVMVKATEYMNTTKVKQIGEYAANYITDTNDLHFDIKAGTQLSISNLIALILYCDLIQLSTKFCDSFRAMKAYESLESIKKRNGEFWWLSRILRETVQYYGQRGNLQSILVNREGLSEDGPFYCGMSCIMLIPEFCIHLYSPTSTSTHIEVVMNGTTDNGIIMQLNREGHSKAHILRSFDCSWVSNYKEESEKLFFGGRYRIRIQSIRILETEQNFRKFFNAMFIFDCMMDGIMNANKMKINTKDAVGIIKGLLNQDGTNDDMKIDNYIQNTFKLFCNNKKQIIVNIDDLNGMFWRKEEMKGMRSLIFEFVEEKSSMDEVDKMNADKLEPFPNLLNKRIFDLFKNVEHVDIYSTNTVGSVIYPFSLTSFLNVIKSSPNWTQINIKAARDKKYGYKDKGTWLSDLWLSSASSLESEYKANNISVSFKQKCIKNTSGAWEDHFVVQRI